MTALATLPVSRRGTGWEMDILPNSILLTLDSCDVSAMKRGLDDLESWSNIRNWSACAVGFDAYNHEIWVLIWEPCVTSW